VPKISIIMPCFNHSRFLVEAIESIRNQVYEDFELIVTDDCSKDDSADIIRRYEKIDRRIIGVFHEKNSGEGKSRNDALAVSSGEFIAFCDSDDVWEKEKLSLQLECFKNLTEYGAIHSDSMIIDENSQPTGQCFSTIYQKGMRLSGDLFDQFCISNFINVPTVMLRRKCIEDAGYFEEDFRYLADWIYWVSVSRRHTFFYLDKATARYRVHSDSTSLDTMGFARHRIKAFNLILDRFPDISDRIRSKIFYHLGMQYYRWLGERDKAAAFFIKSIEANPSNLKSYIRLFLNACK
jgi:glycosyltransferase involved in cell wall biosynthesis